MVIYGGSKNIIFLNLGGLFFHMAANYLISGIVNSKIKYIMYYGSYQQGFLKKAFIVKIESPLL